MPAVKSIRIGVLVSLTIVSAGVVQSCGGVSDSPTPDPAIGSAEDRRILFEYLVERTMDREAFSPEKNRRLNLDVEAAMRSLEDDIVGAASQEELFYALLRLSNARRDRHLSVSAVDGGLTPPAYYPGGEMDAPIVGIRTEVDYSVADDVVLFVTDVATDARLNGGLQPGDLVTSINGVTPAERLEQWRPYMRYSTELGFRRKFTEAVTTRTGLLPPQYYDSSLELEVTTANGESRSVSLPYVAEETVSWQSEGRQRYPGFEQVADRATFDLYLPSDDSRVLVLDWHRFHRDLVEDMDWLMDYAEANDLLSYDIVFDATRSGGGSLGAYAIQRLSPMPFKTTFGNLKISDVIPMFIAERVAAFEARQDPLDSGGKETIDDGRWLVDWLTTDVQAAYDNGDEYSNNVPFKLAHAPRDSDGIIQPADVHFRGRMICLMGPNGGSHLDQFFAIVTENDLCPTIGMQTGGYSNTWEWHEDVVFESSGRPVVEFMWNIGHTISPDGRIVEGDPPPVDESIPLTHDNFQQYDAILLRRALEILNAD